MDLKEVLLAMNVDCANAFIREPGGGYVEGVPVILQAFTSLSPNGERLGKGFPGPLRQIDGPGHYVRVANREIAVVIDVQVTRKTFDDVLKNRH